MILLDSAHSSLIMHILCVPEMACALLWSEQLLKGFAQLICLSLIFWSSISKVWACLPCLYIPQNCQCSCIPLTCQCSVLQKREREQKEERDSYRVPQIIIKLTCLNESLFKRLFLSSVSHFILRTNLEVYR